MPADEPPLTPPDSATNLVAPPTAPSYDAAWVASGSLGSFLTQIVSTGAGFAASVILARVTGPSGKGVVALLIASVAIPAVIANPGLGRAAQYLIPRQRVPVQELIGFSVTYCVVIGCSITALIVWMRGFFADLFLGGSNSEFVWIVAPLVPASLLSQVLSQVLLATGRLGARNAIQVAQNVLLLILLAILVVARGEGIAGALLASTTAGVVAAGATTAYVIRACSFSFRWREDMLKEVLGYGLRHYPAGLATTVFKRAEYFLIAFFLGVSAVGVYSVAAALADAILIAPRAVQDVATPAFAAGTTSRGFDLASRIVRVTAGMSLIVVGPILFGGVIVIPRLFGPDFAAAVPLFGILLVTFVLYAHGPIMLSFVAARGRAGTVSLVVSGVALANVLLTVVLVPRFGLTGNAIATVVAYLLMTGLAIMIGRRVGGRRPWRTLVPRAADFIAGWQLGKQLLGRWKAQARSATRTGG